ncbi:MAG: HK97-gp10 family putative phage morphogenesis protein [Candidatus Babeliales bacterium]
MIELETDGFQEMIDALDNMGKEGETVFKKALNEGAKPVLDAMKRKVYSVLHKRTGELQRNIKIGTVRKLKSGVYSQIVGISKGDITKAFYGKFSEYGSSHEPARPWIRPAFDESKDEAYQKIEEVVFNGIESAFKK